MMMMKTFTDKLDKITAKLMWSCQLSCKLCQLHTVFQGILFSNLLLWEFVDENDAVVYFESPIWGGKLATWKCILLSPLSSRRNFY